MRNSDHYHLRKAWTIHRAGSTVRPLGHSGLRRQSRLLWPWGATTHAALVGLMHTDPHPHIPPPPSRRCFPPQGRTLLLPRESPSCSFQTFILPREIFLDLSRTRQLDPPQTCMLCKCNKKCLHLPNTGETCGSAACTQCGGHTWEPLLLLGPRSPNWGACTSILAPAPMRKCTHRDRPPLGFRGKPGFDHRFAGHKRARLYLPQSPQGTNAGHAAPEGMVGMHLWVSSELWIPQS